MVYEEVETSAAFLNPRMWKPIEKPRIKAVAKQPSMNSDDSIYLCPPTIQPSATSKKQMPKNTIN
ncbi:hypothetical protein [Vibrio phage Vaf1]|nr:hypothetical protein [Vibrio phage Vaf1]